jgi:hypothetical protein
VRNPAAAELQDDWFLVGRKPRKRKRLVWTKAISLGVVAISITELIQQFTMS